ncbi:MAG: hypothetical protein WAN53_02395 [Candidatus Bathyarchaeia archaeon]|jgi:hypothetical protein
MSENEIRVIKSPIVPTPGADENIVIPENKVVYYIRLNNGMVVTKPEDFPNGPETEAAAEPEQPTD